MDISGMTNKRRHGTKKRAGGSITRRWVINNLGIIALVLTVLDFAFIYIMQNYYYSASQQYLNTKLTSVTGVLSRYSQDADINFSSEMRSTIENFSDKDKMELMAISSRGRVALTSSGFTPEEGAAMPDYESAMDGGDGYWVGKQGGETIMALSVDISDMNTEYNAIRVVASLDQIQETVNAYIFGVSAVCAGVLLLLVVTGLYFIRSIVRPIKQINATTKQYAKGDFSVRISENSSDEIGDLCVSINQMADELSNTENMKNEFISSVSHELRTPLNAIIGFSELLMDDPAPTEKQEYMRIIRSNGEVLMQQLSDILDLSKIEAGTLGYEYTDVELNAVMEELEGGFRMRQPENSPVRITFHRKYPVRYIRTDRKRLIQVIANFLSNAVKFTSEDSVDFGFEIRGGELYVYVADTGAGIPEEHRGQLFQRFVKAGSFRQGIGIGLTISKSIVETMGGRIGVESRPGKGSTFWFTLPCKPEQ